MSYSRAQHTTYADQATALGVPVHERYAFAVSDVTESAYRLTATATESEVGDKHLKLDTHKSSYSNCLDFSGVYQNRAKQGQLRLEPPGLCRLLLREMFCGGVSGLSQEARAGVVSALRDLTLALDRACWRRRDP